MWIQSNVLKVKIRIVVQHGIGRNGLFFVGNIELETWKRA